LFRCGGNQVAFVDCFLICSINVSNIGFGNLPFVASSVLINKQVLIKSPVKVQLFPDYTRRFISRSCLIKFREQVFVLLFFQCGKEARVEVAKVR